LPEINHPLQTLELGVAVRSLSLVSCSRIPGMWPVLDVGQHNQGDVDVLDNLEIEPPSADEIGDDPKIQR